MAAVSVFGTGIRIVLKILFFMKSISFALVEEAAVAVKAAASDMRCTVAVPYAAQCYLYTSKRLVRLLGFHALHHKLAMKLLLAWLFLARHKLIIIDLSFYFLDAHVHNNGDFRCAPRVHRGHPVRNGHCKFNAAFINKKKSTHHDRSIREHWKLLFIPTEIHSSKFV